jgi:hypothetical protein
MCYKTGGVSTRDFTVTKFVSTGFLTKQLNQIVYGIQDENVN